ncbi:MAG: hypothetical protein J5517_05240 [Eubacterium sp.]|nr:hypothetical protein [Eubacterium sp.]
MRDGKKILFDQFWGGGGWKNYYHLNISEEEFNLAKEKGYMFDYPDAITHQEYLERLKKNVEVIDVKDVADSFLYSLSTRKLEYRSVLGSYWYAIAMPQHEYKGDGVCPVCRWFAWEKSPDNKEIIQGLNTYSFERYKWGGIRYNAHSYALFDLEQFLKLEKHDHTEEDEKILHDILACVYELSPKNKAGALRDLISKKKIFKTNKQEISTILDALGVCGILSSKEFPCYYDDFYHDRDCEELTNDFLYPTNRWRASDGINTECYERVFGKPFVL